MKRQVTLREILGSIEDLRKVSKIPVSPLAAFRISTIVREVSGYIEDFVKQHNEYVDKFSKGEGSEGIVPEENMEEFTKAIHELESVSIEIQSQLVPIEKFGDSQLSAEEIYKIIWIFE